MKSTELHVKFPITVEKRMQGKDISIEEKKATSALYNDIVTPSIGKEIIAETSEISNFADKKYEQMALNNLKKELQLEIQNE